METRQVTELKVFLLIMNNMRGNTEGKTLVAISDDKDKLVSWYNSQKAPERYKEVGASSFESHGSEHTWHKSFIPGPLEWYNPIDNFSELNHWGHGIQEDWVLMDDWNKGMYNHHLIIR